MFGKVETSAILLWVPRMVQLEFRIAQAAEAEQFQQWHFQRTLRPHNGLAQQRHREKRNHARAQGDPDQIVNNASSSRMAPEKAAIPYKLQKIAAAVLCIGLI